MKIFGYVDITSGPVLTVAQAALDLWVTNDINSKLGTADTYSRSSMMQGSVNGQGTYWIQSAKTADGFNVWFELLLNESGNLYRNDSLSGYMMGSGSAHTCQGCTNCIGVYDFGGHVVACKCMADGSCSFYPIVYT